MGRGTRVFIVICLVVAVGALALRKLQDGTQALPPNQPGVYRLATWNFGWLLDETGEDRIRNIRSVIESLAPDVLAAQEIESKSSFKRALPGGYQVAIADDPKEDQELGVAVRSPFKLVGKHKVLFTSPKHDYAFPGRRNVLEVPMLAPDGTEIYLYVVHYKSRGGGRTESDSARIAASRLLLDYLNSNKRDNVVILGDFNDTPGDESLNILESGDAMGGDIEETVGSYLVNLMQPYYRKDYVTQGVYRQYRGGSAEPISRGASDDNDRLRGQYYEFPKDVKVTEALFDQILVSHSIYDDVKNAGVFAEEIALRGRDSRILRNNDGIAYIERHGDLPSDHLPVFADISFGSPPESNAALKRN